MQSCLTCVRPSKEDRSPLPRLVRQQLTTTFRCRPFHAEIEMTPHVLIAPPRPCRRRKPDAPWPTAASGDRGRQAKRGRVRNAEKRAGSRFSDFPARTANNDTTISLDGLDVELVPGLCDIVGPGRAAGTSGRATLPPETRKTHNNQSAVDATIPLAR